MLPDFCSERHRVARKAHRCCECHRTIQTSEVYQYVSGLWEGRLEEFKTCIECELSRDFYIHDLGAPAYEMDPGVEFVFGGLYGDLKEAAADEPTGTGRKFEIYRHVAGIKQRRGRIAI